MHWVTFRTFGKQGFVRLLLAAVLLSTWTQNAKASLQPDKPIHQFTTQNWQTAQGLPQNSVLSIAQTPDGYLWLGTEEGLARFDGVRFTNFDRQNSGLDQNIVQALLVDRKGTLWAGTQGGGLNRFDGEKFHVFNAANGLPNKTISSLFEDEKGVLWIGTDGGGLVRMQNGKFKVFGKADGLADASVFSITGDRHGSLWIGTHGGVSRFFAGHFTNFSTQNGLPSNNVHTVKADRHGDIWVGTINGLSKISQNLITTFANKDVFKANNVYSILEDKAGTIWIGTEAGGIYRFVNGTLASASNNSDLLKKDIWSIFEDKEGSIWIGSAGNGLTCLKQERFTTLSVKDGLPSNTILPVFEDKEGTLWIGSDSGLAKQQNGRTTLITTKEGLSHNLVLSLAQDKAGVLWVGTRHGLSQIRDGKITKIDAEGLPGDAIVSLYIDQVGMLWLGTRSGLTRFDGQRAKTYTTKDGLSNNFVTAIQQDQNGVLWIGTMGGGLNRFQGGVFNAYTMRDGLTSDVINSIYCDMQGGLWLAANNGGLNRLENGKITTFAKVRSMYKDSIFQVLEDSQGYFWLTSNKGIFRYRKKDLNDFAAGNLPDFTSTYYGTDDGMHSQECNGGFQPAGWKGKDGRLYIPTTGGLVFTDDNNATFRQTPLHTVVERVAVDQRDYTLKEAVIAPPGKGRLTFEFTAPSFLVPAKLQFRYMLEGFDKDWVQAGTQRAAYYTNIPPGEYRFRVQVSNGENWSQDAVTSSITLSPHFYQTKTFYFVICFSVFSICAAIYRIRMDQLKQREQKLRELVNERTTALRESERQLRRSHDQLEIRVQERTQELTYANQALGEEVETRRRTEEQLIIAKEAAEAASQAKTNFLTNMSHEIRTPINGILGMTDITLSTNLDEEQREYLGLVKLSADSLLMIVNDILEYSKVEQQQLTLSCAPFRLRTLVNDLFDSLRDKANTKNLLFEYQLPDDLPNDYLGDSERLHQVLRNILDNGIKFTDQGRVVMSCCLNLRPDGKTELHFTVQDTGIGISEDKQKIIFEPFSQADNSLTRQHGGVGIGLTMSYQLALIMGGNLWVDSQLGQGSTFHFTTCLTVDEDPTEIGNHNRLSTLIPA